MHPKIGRTAYKLDVYKKKTDTRINDLKDRMNSARAAGDKEWLKLRKQLLAQKSRVKKRMLIADSRDEFEKRESLLKGALNIIKSNLNTETYQTVMNNCFQELPILESTLMEAIG